MGVCCSRPSQDDFGPASTMPRFNQLSASFRLMGHDIRDLFTTVESYFSLCTTTYSNWYRPHLRSANPNFAKRLTPPLNSAPAQIAKHHSHLDS